VQYDRANVYAVHQQSVHTKTATVTKRSIKRNRRRRSKWTVRYKAQALTVLFAALKSKRLNYQYEVAAELGIPDSLLSKWKLSADVFWALANDKAGKAGPYSKLRIIPAKYPVHETELFLRFIYRRVMHGLPADQYWLKSEFTIILTQSRPEGYGKFKYSNGWLQGFLRRFSLSSQLRTEKKCVSVLARVGQLQNFFQSIRTVQRISPAICEFGCFPPTHIWNTDQIPMPFSLNPNRSYNVRNTPCWIAVVGPSGLDKRQATVQLTIRADGAQVAPPLIIFRGGGCIRPEEKDALNKLTNIRWTFQNKAWADERICLEELERLAEAIKKHCPGLHLLILDNLSSQRTLRYRERAAELGIFPLFTPAGCTDLVQPVDHHVGAWLKYAMKQFYKYDLAMNINCWRNFKHNKSLSASNRRVLLATWLSQAWTILSTKTEFLRSAFDSCGVLIKLDGSHKIKIRELAQDFFPPFPKVHLFSFHGKPVY
jgi:hypothetical protein